MRRSCATTFAGVALAGLLLQNATVLHVTLTPRIEEAAGLY